MISYFGVCFIRHIFPLDNTVQSMWRKSEAYPRNPAIYFTLYFRGFWMTHGHPMRFPSGICMKSVSLSEMSNLHQEKSAHSLMYYMHFSCVFRCRICFGISIKIMQCKRSLNKVSKQIFNNFISLQPKPP